MISAFLLFVGVLVPYFLCSDFASVSLGSSSDISFYLLAVLNTAQLFGRVLPMLVTDWIGPAIILFTAEISGGFRILLDCRIVFGRLHCLASRVWFLFWYDCDTPRSSASLYLSEHGCNRH